MFDEFWRPNANTRGMVPTFQEFRSALFFGVFGAAFPLMKISFTLTVMIGVVLACDALNGGEIESFSASLGSWLFLLWGFQNLFLVVIFFAFVFGAPSYLFVFGPIAWSFVRRGIHAPPVFALIGLLANMIAWPLTIGVLVLGGADAEAALGTTTFVHGFGFVFAPIFAASFAIDLSRQLAEKRSPSR